jgi:hypothetical protein
MRSATTPTSACGKSSILVEARLVNWTHTAANAEAGAKDRDEEGDREVDTRYDVTEPVHLVDGNVKGLSSY